jgi:hypothetical protein
MVILERWRRGDLPLLERLMGDPCMTGCGNRICRGGALTVNTLSREVHLEGTAELLLDVDRHEQQAGR